MLSSMSLRYTISIRGFVFGSQPLDVTGSREGKVMGGSLA